MNRFFLYLDVLGFANLVRENEGARINDLYEVIASLNANDHSAFKVVVFSDTVVVYNVDGGNTAEDAQYLIMFLCEFIRDLMHRLAGRYIYYRAVITYGDFTHYELNGIPCFFGNALVDAHLSEKQLKAIGLFIDKKISKYCKIFETIKFNDSYDFVYVTQALKELERYSGNGFPARKSISQLIEDTDLKWSVLPELLHLNEMFVGSKDESLPVDVKFKYQNSWSLYCKRYPKITDYIEKHSANIISIAPDVDWAPVSKRIPEDCSYAIKSRVEY